MTPFQTLVADPPWQYRDRVGPGLGFGADRIRGRRGAAGYYPTMSVTKICELGGLGSVAGFPLAASAHLYLWTTNAFIAEAHDVAVAWGFRPRTVLTWVKPRIGMGHYFRNTTEHVVFAVRGTLPTKRKNARTDFTAPTGKHSAKPPMFYGLVESMSPGPYLELFAREPREGWTSWGNELKTKLAFQESGR